MVLPSPSSISSSDWVQTEAGHEVRMDGKGSSVNHPLSLSSVGIWENREIIKGESHNPEKPSNPSRQKHLGLNTAILISGSILPAG